MLYRPLRTSAELSGNSVRVHRVTPPVDLHEYLLEFWEYEVDSKIDCVPVQVFPSGCVSMRFNINADGVEPILYGPSTNNNMKGWFYHDWTIFGAVIHPDKAYHLLGLSMHELRDLRINFDCFWPKETRYLRAEIGDTVSFKERIQVFSKFLRKIIRNDVRPKNTFLNAYSDIVSQATHKQDLGEISVRHGTSSRELRRHFSKYLGLGPKEMERLTRVQQGMKNLKAMPASNLASLAINAGYSDQAHFTRELRAFTGFSPKKFASLVGKFHDSHLENWKGMESERHRSLAGPKIFRFK